MAGGSGWKPILDARHPGFLGVSLKHEIESSLFEISLDLREWAILKQNHNQIRWTLGSTLQPGRLRYGSHTCCKC